MKEQIYILLIEDELEVMEALLNDLEVFESSFPLEAANSSDEAEKIVNEISGSGDRIGLILCDHVLPGENGVDFLIRMEHNDYVRDSRKVLVTGQAGLEDTVRAINDADLDHYISKPWTREELHEVVRDQLTSFVLNSGTDPMPYMAILDGVRISEWMRKNKPTDN